MLSDLTALCEEYMPSSVFICTFAFYAGSSNPLSHSFVYLHDPEPRDESSSCLWSVSALFSSA